MTAVRQRTVADMIGRGRIVQLPGTTNVREASFLMARERVGAVLVTGTDGRLDGIFAADARGRLPPSARGARGVAHGRAQEGRVVGVISLRDFVGAELAAIEDEFDFRVHFAEGPRRQP